jgi:threonylcarbamoyladenosine tRNA methylthiotransferase MtaB
VERVRGLAEAGYREAVLTGVDIASYGADSARGPALGHLIRRLLREVPGLSRLRLSSLDPAAIDEDLWQVIAGEERFMPHLHLSLQSASALVLKRMRRRHSPAQAAEVIGRARALRPGIAIGADLIAGFPTETEYLANETEVWVQDRALPYLHVFPYSERPSTPAARMPQVPSAERRARAARLRTLGEAAALKWHSAMPGEIVEVLTEAGGGGHTPSFAPVRLAGDHAPGQLLRARVTGCDARGLSAERI